MTLTGTVFMLFYEELGADAIVAILLIAVLVVIQVVFLVIMCKYEH